MSNKVYDILKWIVCVVLPALATFYVTLAGGISDSKYSSNTEYYNSIMAQAFSDWFMQF